MKFCASRVAIIAGIVCALASPSDAQTWQQIGPKVANASNLPKVATDPYGRIWVTYQDLDTDRNSGSTRMYVPSSSGGQGSWKLVGPAGSNSVSDDWWPNLGFSRDGDVFRASYDYRAAASSHAHPLLNMRVYKPSTSEWVLMEPFPVSHAEAHFPEVEVDGKGQPVVIFRDGNDNTWQWPYGAVSVVRFERLAGGGWDPVFLGGQAFSRQLFPQSVLPYSASWFNCLEIGPEGRIWAAWRETAPAVGNKPVVASYIEASDTWELVAPDSLARWTRSAENLHLALNAEGVPFVVVFEWDRFRVLRLGGGAYRETWFPLGPPIGFGDAPSMAPHVGYREWTAFEIDPQGRPVIAYRAGTFGNRIVVRRFESGQWNLLGAPGFSNPSGEDDEPSLAFSNGAPVVCFRHTTSPNTHMSTEEIQVWTFQ